MQRVVVTGIGAVTPLGTDFQETWEGLLGGLSGIARLDGPEFDGLHVRIGGRIRRLNLSARLSARALRRYDRFVHLALVAAGEALAQGGLADSGAEHERRRTGVIVGSGRGGIETLGLADRAPGPHAFSAYMMSASTPYMASGALAMEYGFEGPSLGVSTACASGLHALGEAMRWIRHGVAERVLAGGAEAPLCRLALGGYDAARALSLRNDEPGTASRPFCLDRDGFVLSEGAALLLLETEEAARRRGARILGELIGFGSTGRACHDTRPDPDAAVRAMRAALRDGGQEPSAIRYLSTHGTSTPLGDRVEASALRRLLGGGTGTGGPAFGALKSLTGHLLAASGPLEAAVALRALREGRLPAARPHGEPDPDCRLPLSDRPLSLPRAGFALCNAFGFGGASASLLLRGSVGPNLL